MRSGGGGERGCLPQGQGTQQASKTLARSSRWESRSVQGLTFPSLDAVSALRCRQQKLLQTWQP